MTCRLLHHSPRFDGKSWRCPDCVAKTPASPLARIHASLASHRSERRMNQRGSTTFIFCLVLMAVLGAVVMTCLLAAPDPQPLLDRVQDSVTNSIGAVL